MQLKKVVEGKHNKESFRYENGKLQMFGRVWDKEDIKTLVEAANLLSHEGYTLKMPVRVEKREVYGMFGESYHVNQKVYDENEDGE